LYGFVTTEPNEIVGAIHPKAQPVSLTRKDWMTWLQAPWDIANQLIHPSPVDEMMQPTDAP
jgi:putative SOS response-associated peptidase YedK